MLPMQRRRRRQRSWLPTGGGAVGPLLLCCALGTSAPSSPWLGVAAAHAASRAPIIPRVGAPSSILSSSVSILSSSSSSSSGLACFVGAARRSPSINHQRRGDRGGGRTVCWDSERGEGPAAGSSRSSGSGRRVKDFAPFKVGGWASPFCVATLDVFLHALTFNAHLTPAGRPAAPSPASCGQAPHPPPPAPSLRPPQQQQQQHHRPPPPPTSPPPATAAGSARVCSGYGTRCRGGM